MNFPAFKVMAIPVLLLILMLHSSSASMGCSYHAKASCVPTATCKNLADGSFQCVCPADAISGDGLKGENNTGCIFKDERVACTTNRTCHAHLAFCSNASFCECIEGYTGNGVTECLDVNECNSEATNTCDRNAKCINIPGSFKCLCHESYKGDGFTCNKTCIDDRSCTNNSFCNLAEQRCECLSGFRQDGDLCIDINECELPNNCHAKANCTNLQGSYNCTCLPGSHGDGIDCISTPPDCQTILNENINSTTGKYIIDPDNIGPIKPFEVFCQMTGTLGITIIKTQFFQKVSVGTKNVTYEFDISVVKKIIEISEFCYQNMIYDCNPRHSMFDGSFFWTDGKGNPQYNWGGTTEKDKCLCGVIGFCENTSEGCNCQNNKRNEVDKGKIFDKSLLPIVSFTRTKRTSSMAKITLTDIKCSSKPFDFAKDCHELKFGHYNTKKNHAAFIDPDGESGDLPPALVYCDMESEKHVGITIVSHNRLTNVTVTGAEINIKYKMNNSQIMSLINSSSFCMQDMGYNCKNAPLMLNNKTVWFDGHNSSHSYWPGAMGVEGTCGCGILNTCDTAEAKCNCDILDGKSRTDFGIIVNKSHLPVTRLSFNEIRNNGEGILSLGLLKCSQVQFGIKKSCHAYRDSGFETSYTYLIDADGPQGPVKPFPVECKMEINPPYGTTIVHHTFTNITSSVEFTYIQASIIQVKTLVSTSVYCTQTFKYQCSQAPFSGQNKFYSFKNSSVKQLKCDCAMKNNCLKGKPCNCDANTTNTTFDTGTIVKSSDLPVIKIEMSNRGAKSVAQFQVGSLVCNHIQKNCRDVMVENNIRNRDPLSRQFYTIDPDGNGKLKPFKVYCKYFWTEIKTVVNVEQRHNLSCFQVNYLNNVTSEQIMALVKISRNCGQTINYQCFQNPGTDHIYYETCDGKTHYDMTGLSNESTCGCGLLGTCKGGLSHKCNCDSQISEWQSDHTSIYNKSRLAVCRVCVKLNSKNINMHHSVNVQVSSLQCTSGFIYTQSSCQGHRNARKSRSGPYFLLSRRDNILYPVYCEMIYNPPTGVLIVNPRVSIIEIGAEGIDIELHYFITEKRFIVDIIKDSVYCTQEMTMVCNSSKIEFTKDYGWYTNNGVQQTYWPGKRGGVGCNGNQCNCQIENGEDQSDTGIITDKNLLPVSRIKFGPSQGYRKLVVGPLKCYKVYRDCQEIRKNGMSTTPLRNNVYSIDPDGAGGESMFPVKCSFRNRRVAVTQVEHSLIRFTRVTSVLGFNMTLNYTLASLKQVHALVNYSKFCYQDVEYQCQKTPLLNNGTNSFGYLVTHDGQKLNRFGVAGFDNVTGCSCMITGTCPKGNTCECDAKSDKLNIDQGVVTKRGYLPLSHAIFQPVTGTGEEAKLMIGSIRCSSKPINFPINCDDAYSRGKKSGSIFIQPSQSVEPFFVYCDMEMIAGTGVTIIRNEQEFTQRIVGTKTEVVYFNVTYIQIEELIKTHKFCYQSVKYNCKYTKFMGNGNAYWLGKGNSKKIYFGDAKPGTKKCSCGEDGRCGGPGNRETILSRACNCDSHDSKWRADAGIISNKHDLPFRALFSSQDSMSQANLTVGKLFCADQKIELNACEMGFHDCHENATCVQDGNSFKCYCKKGYQGRGTNLVATGRECPDDNECRLFMCPWSARCYNLPGTFKCSCKSGFNQTSPTTCEDIDECAEGTHNCDVNANCFNTIGSYFCRCKRSFAGDGKAGDCHKIGICECFGDPHCLSFDQRWLHFQGQCKYTILRDNCFQSGQKPNFRVEALFLRRGNTVSNVSWVKEVTIFLEDLRIDLLQDKEVRVNGITTRTPYHFGNKLIVRNGHRALEMFSDIGLSVEWDGKSMIKILLQSQHVNTTCGLCGDFNGIKEDDWRMGDGCKNEGQLTTNENIFGQSWVVDDDLNGITASTCSKDCSKPQETFNCTGDAERLAEYKCKKLFEGFQECIDLMDEDMKADLYYSCKYDLCLMNTEITDALCQLSIAVITECQKNMKVKKIPVLHYCAKCGRNQEWKSCGYSKDIKTCFDVKENQSNDTQVPCSEGCFCKEGYVQQGDNCILPSDCGCVYNNTYYEIGDPIVINNCGQKGFCKINGTIEMSKYKCHEKASCIIKDGSYDCHCEDGYLGNGTYCYEDKCKGNNCTDPSKCISTEESYYCQCPNGYNTNCNSCEDINECQTSKHECDKIGECNNTVGSYKCNCPKGYYLDGRKCEDFNECDMEEDNCPENSRCFNTPGSFVCKCCSGYTMKNNKCVATGSISRKQQATCCACHGYLCGVKGKICGTDGVTYADWSELLITACEKNTRIKLNYRHKCKNSCRQVKCPRYQICVMDETTNIPMCVCEPCTKEEIVKVPVCSQVNVIYESFCDFKKFQCSYDIEQNLVPPEKCQGKYGDNIVSNWSLWSNCSVTCGVGTRQRTREPLRLLNVYEKANLRRTSTSLCFKEACEGVCYDFKCGGKSEICTVVDKKPKCICPSCTEESLPSPVCARLYIGEYSYTEETFKSPCEAQATACKNNQDFVLVKDMKCDVLPVNCTYISHFVNVTKDGCQSEEEINVGKCSGGCGMETGHCCNAVVTEETQVKLQCPNGTSIIHAVKTAKKCECIEKKFT